MFTSTAVLGQNPSRDNIGGRLGSWRAEEGIAQTLLAEHWVSASPWAAPSPAAGCGRAEPALLTTHTHS